MTDAEQPEGPLPGQLIVASRTEGESLVLSLQGELDLTSAPSFEREIGEAEASNPARIVIDLGQLDFMDSTGLRALLQARERAKAGDKQLALRPGPRQVMRVLELTKTIDVFTFED
jgi:anti-sigma B factor antagonist